LGAPAAGSRIAIGDSGWFFAAISPEKVSELPSRDRMSQRSSLELVGTLSPASERLALRAWRPARRESTRCVNDAEALDASSIVDLKLCRQPVAGPALGSYPIFARASSLGCAHLLVTPASRLFSAVASHPSAAPRLPGPLPARLA